MAGHAKNGFVGPISVPQFFRHFQQVWSSSSNSSRLTSWPPQRAALLPRRLGIAVSGGADSMALTYLCKQLEKSRLVDGLVVKAFVVDHKAREESTREAQTVASWLDEMDVDCEILQLQWPDSESSSSSAFETHARRLRFQALGMACRNSEIETLLMGHHQDDNVETTLWRLCSGARGAGLSGIPPVARIPECHGLYGVSESGSCSILRRSDRHRDLRPPQIHIDQKTGEAHVSFSEQRKGNKEGIIAAPRSSDIKMSTGGILICRPLLSFPKSRLLDTCHHNQVPYVTDPTNFDPTLTPRNAIRSLLSSKKLPRALQAPSILSLIKKSQDLLRQSTELSNYLLKACKIHDFNSEVGTMIVQFPSSLSSLYDGRQAAGGSAESIMNQGASSSKDKDRQIQAMTLRRITELLSPFEENHFPLPSFDRFTERVFPDMTTTTTTTTMQSSFPKRQPFTVGGVMFRPVTEFIPPDPNSSSKTNNNNTWLLSRQPYMRHRLPVIRLEAPVGGSSDEQSQPVYSPWVLWDNRYWFRVRVVIGPVSENDRDRDEQNHLNREIKNNDDVGTKDSITIPITIRPLQQADLRTIYRLLDQYHKHHHNNNNPSNSSSSRPPPTTQQLKHLLSNYAPDTIGFSIPIITTMHQHHPKEGEGQRPLALPTMGIRIPSPTPSPSPDCGAEPSTWTVHWEWMYKRVDTQVLRLMGWEVQG